MGNDVSLPKPDPAFPYFTLSFHTTDKIKLALADKETIEIIRRSCYEAYKPGLQKDSIEEDGSHIFKFSGRPFYATGGHDDAVYAKKLVASILTNLYSAGWNCALSSNLNRHDNLATLFFHRADAQRPVPSIFCLSLSWTDKLQLINGNDQIKAILKGAVQRSYAPGLQDERSFEDDVYELKLCGTPWHTIHATSGVWARKLLVSVISSLHQAQWKLYATINLRNTADCLFFIRDETAFPDDKFCMISLNANDRLRLIDCPGNVINVARGTIQNHWFRGLQGESQMEAGGAHEFKLYGTPWWASGEDAVASRVFINALFREMLAQGWCIASSLNISRRVTDKSVLLFRSCVPATMPHFCLSLNEQDKIRVIKGDQVVVQVVQKVLSEWPSGIQREREYYGSREYKMNGYPWSCQGNQKLHARVLMCRVLALLADHGWQVISSADLSSKFHKEGKDGPTYPEDVDSWFLVYTGLGQQQLKGQASGGSFAPAGFFEPPPSYDDAVKS